MRNLFCLSLFASVLLIAGCSSGNDDNATPSGGGSGGGGGSTLTQSTPCSVQMDVNGTAVSFVSDGYNLQCSNGSSGSADAKSYSGGLATDNTNPLDVEFGKFSTGLTVGLPTDSAFFSFFHTGVWTYGDADQDAHVVTVSIFENGVQYSSACGDQTGSQLNITQMQTFTSQYEGGEIKARITFNCKLYTCPSGGLVKTITNGTAVISLSNI